MKPAHKNLARLICLACCMATAAMGGAPDAVLERLSEKAGNVHTIRTAFVQEKNLAMMRHTMTTRGLIHMSKPDRLAWRVSDPIEYVMVMDGKSIRQWDSETRQRSRISLDGNPALQMAVGQMRQWFAGDYAHMTTDYRITLEREHPVTLSFVPLEDNPARGFIECVTTLFTDDERYLAEIIIEEKGGDITNLRFHDTELNLEIPSAAWELKPITDE